MLTGPCSALQVLRFSTGFYTNGGIEVDFDRRNVFVRYLSGWFTVDLFATVPWDCIVRAASPGIRPVYFRLLRLLAVLRLFKTPSLINQLVEHRTWSIHSQYISFSKFTTYVLYVAHIMASLFFLWPSIFVAECSLVSNSGGTDDSAGEVECTPLGSWRDVHGVWLKDEHELGKEPNEQYTHALYWAVTTITSIGYGDITPELESEIAFVIAAELFGMAFFALLVNQVTRLNDVMDHAVRETRNEKNDVVQYMTQNHLTGEFRERVVSFMNFRATSSSRRAFDDDDPRFQTLSPALRGELRQLVFRPILKKIKIFAGNDVPLQFIDALAQEIHAGPFSPKDDIVSLGAYGHSLCIVLTGQVVIKNNDKNLRLVVADDNEPFFGMSAALDEKTFIKAQSVFQTFTAEALSYCDIARIEHDAFAMALSATWHAGEDLMMRLASEEVSRSD